MSYTKGPWIFDPAQESVFDADGEFVVYETNSNVHDGNLIAAAPDLLEALEAFVNYNAEDNGDVSMLSNEELWLKAERAIARAKGEPE